MPFDKGIGFPHRKKFPFGKLKLGHKHTINNRKETASLPPNIKLNRENSMHIQVPTNQKFPWNKKDHSNSDSGDEDDRLSTISSKEESRSGSEKRRRQLKQDCGCQTDADLSDNLIYRSSIRRRRTGNVCHESNGSINSDEIFLSLPVSDSTDHRGVYRLSPRHSDRSPLLGGYDSSLEGDRKGEDFYFPMNNLSNVLVHENVLAEVPFKSESLHPLNKREPLPIKRTDDSYAGISIKYSSESIDSKVKNNNDESEKLLENGHLVQIDEIPLNNSNSCTFHKSPPTLKIGYSDLYKRRQFPHPVIVEEKSLDKSRYPFSKMQQKTFVSPLQQTGHCINCVITDAIPGQVSRPKLSMTSYTSSAASSASADDVASYGIQKLEEEEVSMLSFRDYMKNRGIDLDMSDVQSSEV